MRGTSGYQRRTRFDYSTTPFPTGNREGRARAILMRTMAPRGATTTTRVTLKPCEAAAAGIFPVIHYSGSTTEEAGQPAYHDRPQ